ncbi:MAG TPA: bifunctional molybdenum cofactor biosynthesis protein MoaC/MoaB [Bacteroidota bacterium]|nr:bifunctional molybdenum cofactor biosynthesis protein MoaC/MoaB [Bacteroidota bacterium]
MRDVSAKRNTLRTAKAVATLNVSPATVTAIQTGNVPKADPLVVARVAAISAAKNTSLLIPYCHQVPLDHVEVDIAFQPTSIVVTASVKAIWKTGVEMEALVAASTAALTLYDMLKIIDDDMEMVEVKLIEKKGGKSSLPVPPAGITAAVLVISDSVSKKTAEDKSGKRLMKRLEELGITASYAVLPDEKNLIEAELKSLVDTKGIALILTTGGTGVSPRDVTPEATIDVIDRRMEGVEEILRHYGQQRVPTSMLSRAVVGIRKNSIIVNFPGSLGAVEDGMNAIFPAILHAFRMMKGEKH